MFFGLKFETIENSKKEVVQCENRSLIVFELQKEKAIQFREALTLLTIINED